MLLYFVITVASHFQKIGKTNLFMAIYGYNRSPDTDRSAFAAIVTTCAIVLIGAVGARSLKAPLLGLQHTATKLKTIRC